MTRQFRKALGPSEKGELVRVLAEAVERQISEESGAFLLQVRNPVKTCALLVELLERTLKTGSSFLRQETRLVVQNLAGLAKEILFLHRNE